MILFDTFREKILACVREVKIYKMYANCFDRKPIIWVHVFNEHNISNISAETKYAEIRNMPNHYVIY